MGWQRSALVVGVVFSGGLSLGFGWRQGWLPIDFPPANTGILDETAEQPAADVSIQSASGPLAEGMAPSDEADSELTPVEGLREPPTESAPLLAPRRVAALANSLPPRNLSASTPKEIVPALAEETGGTVESAAFEKETVTALPPTAPANVTSYDEIDRQIEAGEVLAAHKTLSNIYWKEPARRAEIQDRIDHTARLIFFSPQPHFVEPHIIQPGDRLDAIAAQHKLSWEYLARLNKVDPKRIREGQRLKLVRGPFAAVIELHDFSLTVHLQGYYVKRYTVGIGKDGSSPLGKHAVLNKVVNPQYTDPDGRVLAGDDPHNPLGERWIDLGESYGIHGTIDPDSIGRAASRGCIRLRDADIIEVYDFLVNGSEVVIRP